MYKLILAAMVILLIVGCSDSEIQAQIQTQSQTQAQNIKHQPLVYKKGDTKKGNAIDHRTAVRQ